jgi:AcrR family transcriptional regulator
MVYRDGRPGAGDAVEENGMSNGRPPGQSTGQTSRRRAATRERVLDAARDVFAERGVFGGTVEDICARAGFTRGAFYSNFADKDEVLRALMVREHERLLAHLDAGFDLVEEASTAAGADSDPRATMASIAERLLRSLPADRLFSLVQSELEIHAVRDPEVARAFRAADARFRARVADFLVRGLARLDRELVVPVGDATDTMIAIAERSTRRALLEGAGSDPNALAMTMLPLAMVAITRQREAAAGG